MIPPWKTALQDQQSARSFLRRRVVSRRQLIPHGCESGSPHRMMPPWTNSQAWELHAILEPTLQAKGAAQKGCARDGPAQDAAGLSARHAACRPRPRLAERPCDAMRSG
eukprot:CAMPEP_0204261728 /NCGR_PEP_ID=MMETSP0468-20130131/7201_1 /ASSEMBLY_ACC=CAM_ASM_000383 /TAXON_ID=2969 /ORGANISM="Oxyrrhis marina" /LENGTH=108 /DNA_ID=CAMNT_0051236317 /DNA_START=93 /DNA_END=416 /DNA_ORIENTATION=+